MKYISKEDAATVKEFYDTIVNAGPGFSRDQIDDVITAGRWSDVTETILLQLYMSLRGDTDNAEKHALQLKNSVDPFERRIGKIMLGELEIEEYAGIGTVLSRVQPQKIPWLWYPRLALGKITMLDGDPGLGKSLIGADLGARVTLGRAMPDGSPCLAPGGVVAIMPEDTLEDTIQPRFARAGADLSMVLDLSIVDSGRTAGIKKPFSLQKDLDYLEDGIKRVDARLVYIDPIMALLAGNTNTNKDDDVRNLLLPLKMLIEKMQVACVLVRHMTKTRGENALMAGQGSIAFIGVARTGLTVARHPQDKSRVILSHIKSNIGPLAPAMTYTIESDEATGDERPYITWHNDTPLDEADPPPTTRKQTAISENNTRILTLLTAFKTQAMSFEMIAAALPTMIPSTIKATLKRLIDHNEVVKTASGLYQIAQSQSEVQA